MRVSPKMGLRIWNELLDNYDHEQLADNWAKVDAHDHTEGRGVLIPTEGISPGAITETLLEKEIQERIFQKTIAYGIEKTVAKEKPESFSLNALIVGTVKVKTNEALTLKILVGGTVEQEASFESGVLKLLPVTFFVPKGKSWEWNTSAGTVESFKYKVVEL